MFIHHRYGSSGFRVYWNVSDHITLKFSLEPHETITYSFCLSDWQQHRIAPLKLFWSADINKTLAFFFSPCKERFPAVFKYRITEFGVQAKHGYLRFTLLKFSSKCQMDIIFFSLGLLRKIAAHQQRARRIHNAKVTGENSHFWAIDLEPQSLSCLPSI